MDMPEQQWFFRLVEKYGKSPVERLVAVFGIVENLMQAPDIRKRLAHEFPGDANCLYTASELNRFLAELAGSAGMIDPAGVAQQLAILLQGAIAEELRNPRTGALSEAAKVARVVVSKSDRVSLFRNFGKHAGWASAGAVAALLLMLAMGWLTADQPKQVDAMPTVVTMRVAHNMPAGVSPDEIDAVLTLQEQIKRGICRAPHLLALPPGQMTAYMNVIESRTPEDPAADERNLRQFLAWFDTIKSQECYTPPMNGHTAVRWTKS